MKKLCDYYHEKIESTRSLKKSRNFYQYKKKMEYCIVNNFPCLLTKIVIGVGVSILGGVFLKKYFFTK